MNARTVVLHLRQEDSEERKALLQALKELCNVLKLEMCWGTESSWQLSVDGRAST